MHTSSANNLSVNESSRSTMDLSGSQRNIALQRDANLLERELFLGEAGKYEHLRITRNVVLVGIAFMLHFTAFHGTANLQSSINSEGALGSYTLAAIYGSLILSNIFLPAAVIRWVNFPYIHVLISQTQFLCCDFNERYRSCFVVIWLTAPMPRRLIT